MDFGEIRKRALCLRKGDGSMKVSNAIQQVEKHIGELTAEKHGREATRYSIRKVDSMLDFLVYDGDEEISELSVYDWANVDGLDKWGWRLPYFTSKQNSMKHYIDWMNRGEGV